MKLRFRVLVGLWVLPLCLAARGQSGDAAGQPPSPGASDGGHGKVLFSRSAPDVPADGAVVGPDAAPAIPEDAKPVPQGTAAKQSGLKRVYAEVVDPAAAKIADEEREAITFSAYDLDIRLFAHQQSLAVRAVLTVRNDGRTALMHIRLQLSSTLTWERISIAGRSAAFKSVGLPSDADHTGVVDEAVIELPVALEPGGMLKIEAVYSGEVALDGRRLQALGMPADNVRRTDWDELSDDMVAMRGFGNVLWYPASSPPVALGDGAKYFIEAGRQKLRQSNASFRAAITEEFVGQAPNVAVINGMAEPVTVTAPPAEAYPGIVTCSLTAGRLGFIAPSLFLLTRKETDAEDLQVYASDGGMGAVQNYLAAEAAVSPLIHHWLGGRVKTPLAVVDLPEAGDAPFETGNALVVGLGAGVAGTDLAGQATGSADPHSQDTQKIAVTLSHALSHTYFQSPRPWLNEGVAQFIGSEWLAQSGGREVALEANEPLRNALALAEPGSPGDGHGVSLLAASEPVYYRTKAAYVLGMLRDIAGEAALAAALRAYAPAEDTRADYFEDLVEKAGGKDLKWFFEAWVYQDLGLPDLSIARVFSSASSEPAQYLVTIDVANDGYAEAEVPVTVRSKEASVTERVRVAGHGKITHRILLRGEPVEVQVNDGSVPEVAAAIHRESLSIGSRK
ncbi:MAG TPA: hypothetical protein VGD64_09555 [Acidisarcina sp.]